MNGWYSNYRYNDDWHRNDRCSDGWCSNDWHSIVYCSNDYYSRTGGRYASFVGCKLWQLQYTRSISITNYIGTISVIHNISFTSLMTSFSRFQGRCHSWGMARIREGG